MFVSVCAASSHAEAEAHLRKTVLPQAIAQLAQRFSAVKRHQTGGLIPVLKCWNCNCEGGGLILRWGLSLGERRYALESNLQLERFPMFVLFCWLICCIFELTNSENHQKNAYFLTCSRTRDFASVLDPLCLASHSHVLLFWSCTETPMAVD